MALGRAQTDRRPPWLMLFIGLALARGLLYAALTPPWQAPDETGHFEYAWHIARLGRLPAPADARPEFEQELIASLYAWRYGDFLGRPLPDWMPDRMEALPDGIFARNSRTLIFNRFSLAYVWQALFLFPASHEDLATTLYLARVSSVLLNALLVGTAWGIFREMGLPEGWAAAATAFLVFWPQHTYINAMVNEGPLAELCAAFVLWGWARLLRRGLSVEGSTAVVGGTLLGLWTKNTAAVLVPLSILLAIGWGGYGALRRRRTSERLAYLGGALLVLLALTALTGWTPVGRWMADRMEAMVEPPASMPQDVPSVVETLTLTAESLWGRFGWMNVRIGDLWYLIVGVLLLIALEGWLLPRSRAWAAPRRMVILMALFVAAVVAGWAGFAFGTPSGRFYAQGRYLFPAAIPLAGLVAGGWGRWAPGRTGVALLLLAWILLDGVAVVRLIHFFCGG